VNRNQTRPRISPCAKDRRTKRRRRRRCKGGSTLLEVLVALVILGMIVQMVIAISSQTRLARQSSIDAHDGVDAAMLWRAARLSGEPWTVGDHGNFPQGTLRWTLNDVDELDLDSQDSGHSGWHTLHMWRGDASASFWQMTVYLTPNS
jgi:Tfp pilus assembly protein PilV